MKTKKNRKPASHSGSTFDKFLEEEGIKEEVEAVAIKRVAEAKLRHVSGKSCRAPIHAAAERS